MPHDVRGAEGRKEAAPISVFLQTKEKHTKKYYNIVLGEGRKLFTDG